MASKFDGARAMLTTEKHGKSTGADLAPIVGDTAANCASLIAQVTSDISTTLSAINTLRNGSMAVTIKNITAQVANANIDVATSVWILFAQGLIRPQEWNRIGS